MDKYDLNCNESDPLGFGYRDQTAKELIGGEFLVITNRYEGWELDMGDPHILVYKNGKYGLGEVYCGSEGDPHPLMFLKDKREFVKEFVKICWFDSVEQFLWLMNLNIIILRLLFDWDEDSDLDEFQERVKKYFLTNELTEENFDIFKKEHNTAFYEKVKNKVIFNKQEILKDNQERCNWEEEGKRDREESKLKNELPEKISEADKKMFDFFKNELNKLMNQKPIEF